MAVHTAGYSFDGCIREFPGICVDKFNKPGRVYLLTHCHSDHLVGLDAKSFGQKVYCSRITKELTILNEKYCNAAAFLYPIDFNRPFTVYVEGCYVKITLIPAYHCPGATMFLLESSTESVLITGDIRAESWWVNSLVKNPYLFPYTCAKTLQNIYFDSTFCYRGEPYIEIPSNNDGIETVIELIKLYPLDDPEIEFNFRDTTLGFEEAWSGIVNALHGNLNINSDLNLRFAILKKDTFSCIPYGITLNDVVEKKTGPTFHVSNSSSKKIIITIKQCIHFNIMDLSGVFLPVSLALLPPEVKQEIKVINRTKVGNQICNFRGRNWILPKNESELLPLEIKLIFSRHSSYLETCHLISIFKPMQVFPCCESKALWKQGFSMNRLFGKFCRGNQFSYDIMMFKIYGNSSNLKQPIIVNRWDPRQVDKEYNRLVDLHNENDYQFIGQYHLNKLDNTTKDQNDFKIAWNKDLRLQNIIAGRGEEKYKKIIQNYQKIYFQSVQRDVQFNINDITNYLDHSSSESTFRSIDNQSFLLKLEVIIDIPDISSPNYDHEEINEIDNKQSNETNQITTNGNYFQNKNTSENVKRQKSVSKIAKAPRPALVRNNKTTCKISNSFKFDTQSFIILKANTQPLNFVKSENKKATLTINNRKVDKICSQLKQDPSKWFSLQINSLSKS